MSNPVFYISPEYLERQPVPTPSSTSISNQVSIYNSSTYYSTEHSDAQWNKGSLQASFEKSSTVEVIPNPVSQIKSCPCQPDNQKDGNAYNQIPLQSSSAPSLASVQPMDCRSQQQHSGQTIYHSQQCNLALPPVQQQQQQQQLYPIPLHTCHQQFYPIPHPPYQPQPVYSHNQPSFTPKTSFLPPISKKYLPDHRDQVRCPGCRLILYTPLGAPQFYCPCGMLLMNANYRTGYIPPQ